MSQGPSRALTAVSKAGAVATIEMVRPQQRNALSPELINELIAIFEGLDEDDRIRVIILKGAGISFCVGFDLMAMGTLLMSSEGLSEEQLEETALIGRKLIDTIRVASAITIAQVQGHAIGGGFLMALACDLCVAGDDTVLSIPEVDVGLPLLWGGVTLAFSELGPPLARDLILTGRQFLPGDVSHTGFPHRVVPADEVDEHALKLAGVLSNKPAPAIKAIKKQFKATEERAVVEDTVLFRETALHPQFLEGAMVYFQNLRAERTPDDADA